MLREFGRKRPKQWLDKQRESWGAGRRPSKFR